MKVNRVKQTLKAGDCALGTMIHKVRNPELAYLLVDTEHAAPDTETIQNLTRTAKSAGLISLESDRQRILHHRSDPRFEHHGS